jgi:hypothetical protein
MIEFLLALSMSILLMGLVIHLSIFLINQENLFKEKVAVENNAQFFEFTLAHEIQMAGFCGCNVFKNLSIVPHVNRSYFPLAAIRIFSKYYHPFGKHIHPESDILVIESMSNHRVAPVNILKPSRIKIDLTHHVKFDDPLIISNCDRADVLMPSHIDYGKNDQFIQFSTELNHFETASVGKLMIHAFFIEKMHKNPSRYALYRYDVVHQQKMECVSGIQSMEFYQGVFDHENYALYFKPLLPGDDLSNVKLLKIVFTLSSVYKDLCQQRSFLVALRE